MKTKPNLDAFLSGSAAAEVEAGQTKPEPTPEPTTAPAAPQEQRITKTIRISREHDTALKRLAFERSTTGAGRISESDIIAAAIDAYLNK